MKKTIFISVLFIIIIIFCGCNKSGSSTQNSTYTPPASGNSVSIAGMAFSAATITIKVGTTVTWANSDYMNHTVTADNAGFTSATLAYGDKFSFTFNSAGTFNYHCKFHSSMTGTVIVQ